MKIASDKGASLWAEVDLNACNVKLGAKIALSLLDMQPNGAGGTPSYCRFSNEN